MRPGNAIVVGVDVVVVPSAGVALVLLETLPAAQKPRPHTVGLYPSECVVQAPHIHNCTQSEVFSQRICGPVLFTF